MAWLRFVQPLKPPPEIELSSVAPLLRDLNTRSITDRATTAAANQATVKSIGIRTWLETLRRYFLLPRRPGGFGNGNGSVDLTSELPSELFLGFCKARPSGLHGRFFASPGFEKIVADTDSIDRRLITFRSTGFGGPTSPPTAAFVSVLKNRDKIRFLGGLCQ